MQLIIQLFRNSVQNDNGFYRGGSQTAATPNIELFVKKVKGFHSHEKNI